MQPLREFAAILYARWHRYWHCLYWLLLCRKWAGTGVRHRATTVTAGKFVGDTFQPSHLHMIACECGKVFWEKPDDGSTGLRADPEPVRPTTDSS